MFGDWDGNGNAGDEAFAGTLLDAFGNEVARWQVSRAVLHKVNIRTKDEIAMVRGYAYVYVVL